MSPFLHQWLTATQYIAPLMANFDLSVGNESDIFYQGFGECSTLSYSAYAVITRLLKCVLAF